MFAKGCVIIVGINRQMKLALTQIIFLRMILQFGQLQLKGRSAVAKINQRKPVSRHSANFFQSQRLFIKPFAVFQIRDVKIKMRKFKTHLFPFRFSLFAISGKRCQTINFSIYKVSYSYVFPSISVI